MTADGAAPSLRRALETEDGRTARSELRAATDRSQRDELLDVVARTAAGGSTFALELLVETIDELGLARRMVHGLLVDEQAVEDVAQDTLVAVATGIASFRGDARFSTWLQRVARNRAVDHIRRQRATVPLDRDDVGDAVRISSMIASEHTARSLVSRLPERYRAPMVLRELERLPYEEVADRLGTNVNTVRSHVARGRALLGRMVETELADLADDDADLDDGRAS